MAVVGGTVQDHQGYINVTSAEGVGSRFELFFPVVRDPLPSLPRETPMVEIQGRGERLLVVDDVPEQREIAAQILRKLGYAVAVVASGEAALEYLSHQPIDLIVLDMIMDRGMDGLDTYREIRSRFPGQRTIIASGFAENERVKEAQRLGAGQYIRKPYTLERIGLAVREELARRPGPDVDPAAKAPQRGEAP
jgi:CheY-like chemotaxis protein